MRLDPHCLDANPSPEPVTLGSEKRQVSVATFKPRPRRRREECERRAAYQFIRTEDSELHSFDGAQRACAVPGGGATPMHRGGSRAAQAQTSLQKACAASA